MFAKCVISIVRETILLSVLKHQNDVALNGHGKEPPDKHKSDAIMPENDSIFVCEMEIKQESTIKQEPEVKDGIVTMSRSTRTANDVAPRDLIGDTAMNDTDDFNNFGDSTEAKVEKVKEETNQNGCKSSDKKRIP